jgi:hypothetical protein
MAGVADRFAAVFPRFAARWVGSAAACQVTVRQIDNDSGGTTAAAAGVPALKRARKREAGAIQGGEIGFDTCRFLLLASAVGFLPADDDQITDADGVVWTMDSVEAICFGKLYACNVVKKRN